MDKILKWTVLFIVLIILASGGVAFYSIFLAEKKGMTIPSFREMSLIDAVTDAEQLGLKVRIEQIESKQPTGRVLAQWPEPGAKIRGSDRNVILKISKGGERRPIPDIRGIELARATRMLNEEGFTAGDVIRVKDTSNSGLPAGSVIAQSPAAPGNIPVSNKVDLLVSEGSEDGKTAVPDVSQMTEAEAKVMIEDAELKVAAVEKQRHKNVSEGQVINTRPAAGTMVKKGDGIRIFISMGEGTNPTAATGPGTIPGRPNVIEPVMIDVSVLDQPRRPPDVQTERSSSGSVQNDPHYPELNQTAQGRTPTTPTTATTPTSAAPGLPAPPTPVGRTANKVARVRYQVPPILRPLPLKAEIVDPQGTRVLLERNVRANENVQIEGGYSQEAVVSIWLGGEFVWQERFK